MTIHKYFRAACLTAAATTAIGLLSTGAADADTFIPLANSTVTQTLTDGTVVTLSLTNDSANLSPSMGSTPLHRNAWVSARATMHATNGKLIDGWYLPGYIVGCQINISGGGAGGTASATDSFSSNSVTASTGTTATLSLGPGQEQSFSLLDVERADPFGADANYPFNYFFHTNDAGMSWINTTIALNGCAGYAQARPFMKVRVQTDTAVGQIAVWGPAFSLG
ncbi:MspA family porin [Nocardia jiangxiensis]|uniref:MspA family porin n=1 Tax=Nocardia jiangxiensis TaxID=282685 RepID=A0ABW6SEB2_9NOCA|nr:MspA family porin [Nocardia jiangxiensis]